MIRRHPPMNYLQEKHRKNRAYNNGRKQATKQARQSAAISPQKITNDVVWWPSDAQHTRPPHNHTKMRKQHTHYFMAFQHDEEMKEEEEEDDDGK